MSLWRDLWKDADLGTGEKVVLSVLVGRLWSYLGCFVLALLLVIGGAMVGFATHAIKNPVDAFGVMAIFYVVISAMIAHSEPIELRRLRTHAWVLLASFVLASIAVAATGVH